jgi:superfamily I DNA and/or RNA helicase
MFYDNTLKDGIKSADRSALIPNAPPVMVIDVPHGKEEYVGTGSLYNDAEISAVVNLVKILLNSGFPADELGVITLCMKSFQFRLLTCI